MAEYCEIAPPPRLAETIECCWSMRQTGPGPLHRVMPDGCADILFTNNGACAELDAVGPMTTWRDHPLAGGQLLVGVRFRPGMWTASLGIGGDRLTNEIVPLAGLWGRRAGELLERLAEAPSIAGCVALFEQFLQPAVADPLQRALAWMEKRHGLVSLDRVARQAGLGPRQFRRLCIQQTGLPPKFLARVLRFRHSLCRLDKRPASLAQLALDCGYYDQAHFINEFREFSGRTPARPDP